MKEKNQYSTIPSSRDIVERAANKPRLIIKDHIAHFLQKFEAKKFEPKSIFWRKVAKVPLEKTEIKQTGARTITPKVFDELSEQKLPKVAKTLAKAFGVRNIVLGAEIAYNDNADELMLTPKGLVAALVVAHYFPQDLEDAKEVIEPLIKGERVPLQSQDSDDVAFALFLMHAIFEGIDNAGYCSIAPSKESLGWFYRNNVVPMLDISYSLRRIQGEYLDALEHGKKAAHAD